MEEVKTGNLYNNLHLMEEYLTDWTKEHTEKYNKENKINNTCITLLDILEENFMDDVNLEVLGRALCIVGKQLKERADED